MPDTISGRPDRGDTVAVSGAAGGVGSIAVQLARQAGATVIGLAGRVPAVRHHGQPGGEQDTGDPALGQARERRAVLHAHQRILGQSDRGAVRSGTHLVMGGSDHRNHPALARKLQACLRWRNAHARHPGVLAAQRRERARLRSERQQRWGRPEPKAA